MYNIIDLEITDDLHSWQNRSLSKIGGKAASEASTSE